MPNVSHQLTSRLPAILATPGEVQQATALTVRPINPRGSDRGRKLSTYWEVVNRDGGDERLLSGGKGDAIDDAIERLSSGDGGEVLVMNLLGEIAERARVPAQPLGSCAETLKRGRELHEKSVFSDCPFCLDIPPEMPEHEREFAAALFFIWNVQHEDSLWGDVDEGSAHQYGRFVFIESAAGVTLEQHESTAIAMRRLVEFAYSGPDDPRRPLPRPRVHRSCDGPLPALAEGDGQR